MTEPATFVTQLLDGAAVLFGERNGKYPDCNSLLVLGAEENALFDPGLGVLARVNILPQVDRLLLTHCHEDHIPGLPLFPEVPCQVHPADLPGLRSLERFMEIFGYPEPHHSRFEQRVREVFRYQPRPGATPLQDRERWDLGGGVVVTAIHTPGHTRGHCAFFVEPVDLLLLGDVDLSSFGPYYGDAWSSLVDFERTLIKLREWDCRYYLSGHHVGLLEGRAAYLERLDRYGARIREREDRLLEYLAEPHTLDEIAAHRFVYRPQDQVASAEPVEKRSMSQHLERLSQDGRVEEVEPGRWRARSLSE